ncbi:hypothetical protein SteCoe_35632 [Stentor coeruleus]|uniref:EF-hand domain-containing protein n=1 Tax=Stentor coeruleus TaxID=5963 RepID=A0A1R2ARY1_9CILI|nr:hypothetical protein SteCoe_35632 [Stentor coeruleus]
MEELPMLFKQSPGLQQINLEFSEIESLEPLLPLLSQFKDLKELLLFGNRLETLPSNLSSLECLEKIDISNNLIDSIHDILPGLMSLPNLNELHITMQTENDEELLVRSLLKLKNLNGNLVDRSKFPEEEQESYPQVYQSPEDYEEEKVQESDEHEESQEISGSPAIDENTNLENFENIEEAEEDPGKTYDACESSGYFGEDTGLSQEYLEKVAILYDEIRGLWLKEDRTRDRKLAEEFDEGIKATMAELANILRSSSPEPLTTIYSIKAKYELALICTHKLNDLIFFKNNEIGDFLVQAQEITEALFSDLFTASLAIFRQDKKSFKAITESSQHSSQEPKSFIAEREQMIKRFQEERQEMLQEIESLKEENRKYLDTIVRHSKSFADSVAVQKSMEDNKNYAQQINMGKVAGKILSLRQTKEVIEEIYMSKAKYDERCSENKMPRETMEQHMYNYLNTKYGLKNLILEWASSIIASVKKHSPKDNDVAVFGKILRNECDEEFRFVQIQVKETVGELLKMHIKNKFPLKHSADVLEIVNEKTNGYLFEDEWGEIVRYMYNEEDSAMIIQEIILMIKKKENLNNLKAPRAKISREEAILLREKEKAMKNRILFSDFIKVLLDFQLKGHEKFLNKFTQIFRKVDTDADGIINEQEFRDLVVFMDLGFSEDDIIRLLQIIDPYDNQQITFSEGVALFSTELIPVEGVAVMKKLSLE